MAEETGFTRRARAGGQALAAKQSPEERSERMRAAALARSSPEGHVRALAAAWPSLDRRRRADLRNTLREAGIID